MLNPRRANRHLKSTYHYKLVKSIKVVMRIQTTTKRGDITCALGGDWSLCGNRSHWRPTKASQQQLMLEATYAGWHSRRRRTLPTCKLRRQSPVGETWGTMHIMLLNFYYCFFYELFLGVRAVEVERLDFVVRIPVDSVIDVIQVPGRWQERSVSVTRNLKCNKPKWRSLIV